MLLVASNKMLAKTHLVVSNSKFYWQIGGGIPYFLCLKKKWKKKKLKVRVMKLKHDVDMEGSNVWKEGEN